MGSVLPRHARGHRHQGEKQQAERGFADQRPADADVAVGQPAIAAIEPVEEPAQADLWSFAFRPQAAEPTSAGLSVSALKAEIRTEMAMVTANC